MMRKAEGLIMSQSLSSVTAVGSILLAVLINSVNGALPSTIKVCSRNDPSIDQCIIDAVNHIRPNLATGDFGEGFKMPKIDPMYIEEMNMQRGQDFHVMISKLNVYGNSGFKLERMQSNPMNLSFDFVVNVPISNFTGKYSLKMKLLLFDLQGKGDLKGTMINTRLAVRLRGYTEKIDGKEYVRFHRMGIRMKVDSGVFHLDNLFNGDPVLGQVGNQVINENSQLFLDELTPGLAKNLRGIFTEIINNLLKSATIDDMFPESV